MARVLSDFAAMAGLPQFALVTLIVPAEREARWAKEIYRGLQRVADRFAVAIVGGETSRTDGPAVVSVAAIGTVEKDRWVSRSGGKSGDALFVTGKLGGSIRRKHLNFVPRIAEARWLSAQFSIHAMMDLSDGLGADLPRLAAASGVGFAIERRALPRNRGCSIEAAISDGEDYELLFAIAPNDARSLQAKWRRKFPGLCRSLASALCFRIPASAFRIPSMATFTSNSADETIAFAREWAEALVPNDVVALCGDLGAGKTHFVKGLVPGLAAPIK